VSDTIVGIDLGTTNSVVAAVVGGQVQVYGDDKGFKIQPSVVSFHPNGTVVVGAEAKQRRIIDPRNTVYSAKRLIGRSFKSKEVATSVARMPYTIKEGVNEQPVIATRGGEFAVPEISAIVLDHMRSIAQKALGGEVSRAVVTVPANFNDAQRSATATAGAIAGLTVVRVLNEPTAAALAYGRGRALHETVAVYDFGGGTFDITVLRLRDDVFEVLGTAGDTFLGGDDLDERLVDHMVEQFLRDTRSDLRADELAMQRLRAVAEQTKIELSRRSRAIIKVDEIAYAPGGKPLDLQIEITRDEFVAKVADLVDRTFPVCEAALRSAGIVKVDEVVLVGGTTKIPYVRERVQAFFDKPPRTDVSPDEAVAIGAAIQAEALAQVLAGGPRPTARTAAAVPPAPPMEARPAGADRAPPPTPADAVARKIAPPPRQTRPRIATTTEREAQEPTDTIVLDEEEPTGIRARPLRRTQPGAATPPPVPGAPVARVTRPGPATPPKPRVTDRRASAPPAPFAAKREADPAFSVDTGVATNPGRPGEALSWEDLEITGIGDGPTGVRGAGREATSEPTREPITSVRSGEISTSVQTDPGHVTRPEPVIPRVPPVVEARTPEPEPVTIPVAPVPQPPPRAPIVLDVVPQGVGVGTVAGFCDTLIARHARLPCDAMRRFTTSADYQTTVNIRVCMGDSRRIDENVVLGMLVLDGIEGRPRGQSNIAVTFRIDESGLLLVSARDEHSGAEQRATLHIVGAQSPEEIAAARERFREITGVAD
jgi:molecular chaperone DnaK